MIPSTPPSVMSPPDPASAMTQPSNVVPLPTPAARGITVGGILPILSQREVEQNLRRQTEVAQAQPVIQGLAAHVRRCWDEAKTARQEVEQRMLKSLRQRRGEYDPDKLTLIRQQGGSEIFMMITAAKCRGAAAWLRDSLLGTGADKPWTVKPSPMPELPPDMVEELRAKAIEELSAFMRVTGKVLQGAELREYLTNMRAEFVANVMETAKAGVALAERKMEDQLEEGHFRVALDRFLDDLTTFPAAVIKGPIVRRKMKLSWVKGPDGKFAPQVAPRLVPEWERVDPFNCYPAPGAENVDDGYFIEKVPLRPHNLEEMIGVPGYSEGAIRAVLEEHQRGGLREWTANDVAVETARGKSTTHLYTSNDPIIDALQFWGRVSGQMLLDWGVEKAKVPDTTKQYDCEVWLIGRWVIKATVNPDPLGRKPYYKACYENIPGAFWGNAPPDLVRDAQDMCNSAARAVQNNAGIASGPQVWYNVDRLPAGANLSEMHPWKIWQGRSDPMGSTAAGIEFFQPQSNVRELMELYDRFSIIADEHSNIPRYMTGDAPTGGAGRTASGFSQLQNNAMKSHKQVLSNIDLYVISPIIERLYDFNMRTSDDPHLKRDLEVVARGASGIIAKESTQVRRNEFLAATANPMDFQIMGPEGRGAVLREQAKALDMDADDVVPNPYRLKQANMVQQALAAGGPQQPQDPANNGQELANGAPVTDTFSPVAT